MPVAADLPVVDDPVVAIGYPFDDPVNNPAFTRVLFGTNAGQITPAQGLQIAAAAASLAGGGGGFLDKIRSSLGLDRFDFGSGNTANNAAGNRGSVAVVRTT